MAASNATLAVFNPKDADLSGSPVSLQPYNGVPALKFGKESISISPQVFFSGVLLRPTLTGYTGTTGIQVKIHWAAGNRAIVGAVRWSIMFDLKGATDLPLALADNLIVPAPNGNPSESTGANNVNAVTPGGLVVTTINVTIANIKLSYATPPAAGDFYRLRVRRATERSDDTLADAAYILAVELVDF